MRTTRAFIPPPHAGRYAAWTRETSRMDRRYLLAIERTLQSGTASEAVTLAAALPHICTMLESPNWHSSPACYISWCDDWLEEIGSLDEEPLTGVFLYHLHTLKMIPRQLFCATREEFERLVSRALIEAARRWYRERGADDATVQYNLDRAALWKPDSMSN
jgi:hypothetical protein